MAPTYVGLFSSVADVFPELQWRCGCQSPPTSYVQVGSWVLALGRVDLHRDPLFTFQVVP